MLPVDIVRRYARSQGYEEVQFNPESRVIGFVRGDQRVNVYYTTGWCSDTFSGNPICQHALLAA